MLADCQLNASWLPANCQLIACLNACGFFMMYTTLPYSLNISFHRSFLLHNIRCMRKGCKCEAIFSAVALTEGTQKTTELLEASIQVQCITKDIKETKTLRSFFHTNWRILPLSSLCPVPLAIDFRWQIYKDDKVNSSGLYKLYVQNSSEN